MESEVFWQAVTGKDARFDGAFVFGVRTTGIFCRPSCSARRPKRENVQFFAQVREAEACGFRACLRCKPKIAVHAHPVVQKVVAACREIEEFPEAGLADLAETAEMSTYHFQRKFKEIIGVSPKKYSEAIKMERFKEEVRASGDVTGAMYGAGFGSSRGLYEKAAEGLGMTPSAYKKGGAGMKINYTITDSELGKLLVARTKRGICSVTFGDSISELEQALRNEFRNAEIAEEAEGLKGAVDSILKYLEGKNKRLILPLDLRATAFQM
ncbi:MAG: helix-turn-helix domain-containing protein, partial [Acidobacteria bacterium]|nr:helix-turn-helix domain-containing protein [Acidobacteriota bacterium]